MATAPFQGTQLATKIVKIMREVEHVEKRGTHEVGDFDYQTASDVTHAIRKKLVAYNVALLSDEQECVEGKLKPKGSPEVHTARIKTLYTLIDGDSGERETFSIFAAAHSDNVPAVNAAKTSSLKYALKQTFLIADEPAPAENLPVIPPAEKKRAAMEQVKTASAEGNLKMVEVVTVRDKVSSNRHREFQVISYREVGSRERKTASCWVDPMKPIIKAHLGAQMLVRIEMSTEGDKVHTNFVDVLSIAGRALRKIGGYGGAPVSYEFAEASQ